MEVKTTRIPLRYLIISSLFFISHPKTKKKSYGNTMTTPLQDILDETICLKQFLDMQHGIHFGTTLPSIYLAVQFVKKINPNKENKPVNSTLMKSCHIHGIQSPSI
jgi:hypothetical protein